MDIEGSSHIILTAMNGVVNFRLRELREHDKCCRALSSTIKLQFDIHRDLCRPQSPLNQLILMNTIMVLLLTTSMTSLGYSSEAVVFREGMLMEQQPLRQAQPGALGSEARQRMDLSGVFMGENEVVP